MKPVFFGIKYLTKHWILGKTDPLICGLVLHNKCNLRCRHCTIVDRPSATMSYEEAVHVMDSFYEEGGRCVYLEGGEPFIWKDNSHTMEDVVAYARNRGYYAVIIYTNGTKPLVSDANTLFVSVDGMQSTHDYLRGKSFERIMENIRNSDHPSLYINYTINSVNRSDITDFCRYMDVLPQVKGTFFYFHTPYYGYDELYLDSDAKRKVLLELLELKKNYKILNSVPGLRSAMRNDWRRNLEICKVYEEGKIYNCCRESRNGEVCKDCGYLSYAEIDQSIKLKPGAIFNALKYF